MNSLQYCNALFSWVSAEKGSTYSQSCLR